jgi:biopolymer transport protein ExbB
LEFSNYSVQWQIRTAWEQNMAIVKLFTDGGVVMYPLLAFSVVAIALIIERVNFWYRLNTRQSKVVREVLNLYRLENVVGALDKLQNNEDLPIARVFLSALELEGATPEEFRLALESEAQAEIPILKRFNNIFETIISLAPLLGLLGTVLGLIASFESIDLSNGAGTSATRVTGGISQALVSTASGLVVAIFVLMFANTFRGFYQRQIAFLQEYGGQLELLYRRRYERGGDKSYAATR